MGIDNSYIFTFGMFSQNRDKYLSISADSEEEAKQKIKELGIEWSYIHNPPDAFLKVGVEKYRLKKIKEIK